MTKKRVAIVTQFSQSGYSGGRYFVLVIACALAVRGHKVTVYTNCIPEMHREFTHFQNYGLINWRFGSWVEERPGLQTDFVLAVPHLSRDKSVYLKALKFAEYANVPLAFLDFESPLWFNSMASTPRSLASYKGPRALSTSADLILSISKLGMEYAKSYYSKAYSQTVFDYIYPGVNTPVLERARTTRVRDTVYFSTRIRGASHKNADLILELIPKIPKKMRAVILVDDSPEGEHFSSRVKKIASRHEVTLDIRKRISDFEKSSELARARVVVITSEFEGYGYPLVESLHMGAPVICFDLPVFRELIGESNANVHMVPRGGIQELRAVFAAEVGNDSPQNHEGSPPVLIESNFEVFSSILSDKISYISPAPHLEQKDRKKLLEGSIRVLEKDSEGTGIKRPWPELPETNAGLRRRVTSNLGIVRELIRRKINVVYGKLPSRVRRSIHKMRINLGRLWL